MNDILQGLKDKIEEALVDVRASDRLIDDAKGKSGWVDHQRAWEELGDKYPAEITAITHIFQRVVDDSVPSVRTLISVLTCMPESVRECSIDRLRAAYAMKLEMFTQELRESIVEIEEYKKKA